MAANKFASMLHRNCHKIIVILVYAVLEWVLILLLLLNSFFSFSIAKFANFFGLKPSCTWCSRLDHIFDSKKISNSHFDHVCEAHGAEISKLSYCSNHKRLAESKNLCSNCSSSSSTPLDYGQGSEISSTVAFFTWMSEGMLENDEEKRCSCCEEILSRKVHTPSFIFKPSLDVLDYIHKRASLDLMKHKLEFEEKGREDDTDHQRAFEEDDRLHSDGCKKRETVEESVCDSSRGKSDSFEVQEWNSSQNDDPFGSVGCNEDDESVYLADMLLKNADYTDSDKFICIELIDTPSVSSQNPLTTSSQDAEVAGVEEADSFPEPDDDTVAGALPQSSSDSEFFVINSAIIGISEEQETSNQGVEDCLNRSSNSEMEVSDECLSREDLINKIKAQEKALKALYCELEEERKSAEEAAMETMAMITKVQEDKAAMQIEALQYQRMMEEQAEYDQEALQLLNDLMIKREKEKKELEKELESYRIKAMDDEAEEEMTMIRRRESNGLDDDCDDSQFGANEEHHLDDSLEETGEECIRDLMKPDVTLAEFDEERLSILEEVKILEAKLLALHDDEEKRTLNCDDHERETMNEVSNGIESNGKMLIEEELGHVYERLQALEEDKDFLEHCIRSMMKGNKGLDLLQEILQHLRDLKSVELSATNMAKIPLSDASMMIEDHNMCFLDKIV